MKISSSITFLIVDDYPSVRTMVKQQLKQIGFKGNFHEAEAVDQALETLENYYNSGNPVEFIITDWLMPGKTGLDLINEVRSNEKFNNLPILVLTTQNDKATVIDTLTAGASNYLLKPWSLDDMANKIAKAWEKHYQS